RGAGRSRAEVVRQGDRDQPAGRGGHGRHAHSEGRRRVAAGTRSIPMASRLTDKVAHDAEMRLVARIEATAAAPPDGFPHAADPASGQWQGEAGGAWTDGFWV